MLSATPLRKWLPAGAALALFGALPAGAQRMFFDWERVGDCRSLNAFERTHRRSPGYGSYAPRVAARRARLCPRQRPPRPGAQAQAAARPTARPPRSGGTQADAGRRAQSGTTIAPRRPVPPPVHRPVPPRVIAPPPRQPVRPVSFQLSGARLAGFYATHWFCYDFQPGNFSCASVERLDQQPYGRVTLYHISIENLSQDARTSLRSSSMSRPTLLRVSSYQEQAVVAAGLCRDRIQEISDTSRTVLEIGDGSRYERVGGNSSANYVTTRRSELGNQTWSRACSRYTNTGVRPNGHIELIEQVEVDGRQNATARITLLPRNGPTPSLRPR